VLSFIFTEHFPNVSRIHYEHMANASRAHRERIANTLRAHRERIPSTLRTYREHITSTSRTHPEHIANVNKVLCMCSKYWTLMRSQCACKKWWNLTELVSLLDLSECQLMSFPDAVYHLMRNTELLSCDLSSNVFRKIPPQLPMKFVNVTGKNSLQESHICL